MGEAASLRSDAGAAARFAFALLLLAASCRGAAPVKRDPSVGQVGAAAMPLAQHESHSAGAGQPVSAESGRAPEAPAPTALEPLAGSALVHLVVPGFRDAVVSIPLGATEPRPIALALHGNFDRPEWQCEVWRGITQAQQFVLCPRGVPRRDVSKQEDRWEWGSLAKTRDEVVAALAALRERFGGHVSPGPIVFTGFSLGAILGARLIQDPTLGVGAAVLTEGGYAGWSLPKAKAAGLSVRSLLFACGQTECRNQTRQNLPVFTKAGLKVTLVSEVKAGHTYDGAVAEAIRQEWPALIRSLSD